MFCEYGCGLKAEFQTKSGRDICAKSPNSCPINKNKNSQAGKTAYTNTSRKCSKEIYRDLPDTTKTRMAWSRGLLLAERAFTENSSMSNDAIKRYALANQMLEEKCYSCGLTDWLQKPIKLELDHKNGLNTDNRIENLHLLCPNCHSQTPNFRGKNINNGATKVSDDKLIQAIQTSKNIRQTLLKVGLTPKGGNYTRVQEMMIKNGLVFKK